MLACGDGGNHNKREFKNHVGDLVLGGG